jgi:hypothetical protein
VPRGEWDPFQSFEENIPGGVEIAIMQNTANAGPGSICQREAAFTAPQA